MTMNRRKAALDALDIIISQAYVESVEIGISKMDSCLK